MQNEKLKVGLLLDGVKAAAWAYRMIEIIDRSDYAEVSLILQNKAVSDGPATASGIEPSRVTLIDRFLMVIQTYLVGRPGYLPNAFQPVDTRRRLAGVDLIEVSLGKDGDYQFIESEQLKNIGARKIDVLIQLGSGALRGEIMNLARFGVWFCGVGDLRMNKGNDGLWEVMESRPETGSTLQILTAANHEPVVGYRSFSSTNTMSLLDNRSNVMWKTLHFIPRALKELHREGGEFFFQALKERNQLRASVGSSSADPTTKNLVILIWKKVLEKIGRKWEDTFYFKQWSLLYDFHDGISASLEEFRHLTPPKDRFWADPFVVERKGKYYVFVEEYLYATRKGHISLIVLNKDGSHEPPVRVLETIYHLSYPFIFEFEGELYMIPESGANRTVDLFKCTDFPLKWEFQKHLMENVHAVDATLFQSHGKWWMFVNQVDTNGASSWDELYLYHSDSPLSTKWIPHRRNPVVSDVRSARPAGRMFLRDGRIIRPSQNCGRHYGYGFNFCEIKKLTETEYEEAVVQKLEPKWDKNIISTHTINYADGVTVVDCQLSRRK